MQKLLILSLLLVLPFIGYSDGQHPENQTPPEQHEFYEEVGLPKEVVDKMSSDQILELIYHKDALAERIEHDHHEGNARPSNFLIFGIISAGLGTLLLIILGTYYYHYMIRKNQYDIIYKAIEEGQEIPENLFKTKSMEPRQSLGIITVLIGIIFWYFMMETHGPWPIGLGISAMGAAILLLKKRRSY